MDLPVMRVEPELQVPTLTRIIRISFPRVTEHILYYPVSSNEYSTACSSVIARLIRMNPSFPTPRCVHSFDHPTDSAPAQW